MASKKLRTIQKQLSKDSISMIDTPETDVIEVEIRKAAAKDFMSSMIKMCVQFDGCSVSAHIAETPAQKATGLEVAADLEKDEGMIFMFDPPEHAAFHMGAVKFPIDILFLLKDGADFKVAKIVHNAPPGSTTKWSNPNTSAVLEIKAGTCKRMGIKLGSVCQGKIRVSAASGVDLV